MSWLRILTTLTLLSASKGADEYCSQLKPLETKHVTSTYEETRDVYGCVSKERDSKNGHQVIGVRVTTTSDEALLTLTGTDFFIFFLVNNFVILDFQMSRPRASFWCWILRKL